MKVKIITLEGTDFVSLDIASLLRAKKELSTINPNLSASAFIDVLIDHLSNQTNEEGG